MQCLKHAMQVDLVISSTWPYTIDETSLNELYRLSRLVNLPLSCGSIVRIDVTLLKPSKLEFDWCRGVAVWDTQDYLQPQVLVTSAAFLRLVV